MQIGDVTYNKNNIPNVQTPEVSKFRVTSELHKKYGTYKPMEWTIEVSFYDII